ncbi:MAG: M48 family metallopeptidase [Candidatus Kapaibacteriota bacterium]|jgi:predicted metal-dependent hydrolase
MIIEIKELVYRKRKNFCLRIDKKGDLIVIAPYFATEKEIRQVVEKKADWIIKTRELILRNKQKTQPLNFNEGETILYLGENYKIVFHNKSEILLDERSKVIFLPYGDKQTLERKLMRFYYEQAKEILKNELDRWSRTMGLRYKTFRLKNAQRLWGSCGKNGSINLNWRLILLPKEILEHIVIHELAHLVHRNHSKQFKYFVSQYSDNYQSKERWLRENSFILQMFRND